MDFNKVIANLRKRISEKGCFGISLEFFAPFPLKGV
jgi:hypothetical protein